MLRRSTRAFLPSVKSCGPERKLYQFRPRQRNTTRGWAEQPEHRSIEPFLNYAHQRRYVAVLGLRLGSLAGAGGFG